MNQAVSLNVRRSTPVLAVLESGDQDKWLALLRCPCARYPLTRARCPRFKNKFDPVLAVPKSGDQDNWLAVLFFGVLANVFGLQGRNAHESI